MVNKKININKKYYNDLFKTNAVEQWETAPGKNVLINFIKDQYENNVINKKSNILDIGCGTGFFLNRIKTELSKNNFSLYGIDFSQDAINKSIKDYSDIYFSCQDGHATNFKNGIFDLVISYGTFEHFTDPKQGISDMSRLLVGGGVFLLYDAYIGN